MRVVVLIFVLFCCGSAIAAEIEVDQSTLPNGLKLFIVNRPQAAEVECRIVYNVGGRTDPPGCTGAAHFCEHLMFKGTTVVGAVDYGKESELLKREDDVRAVLMLREDEARRLIEAGQPIPEEHLHEIGALRIEALRLQRDLQALCAPATVNTLYQAQGGSGLNASTSFHMTQYYVTLPPNKLELFFWLESDRLANPVFRQFYEEKDAVISERNMYVSGTPFGRALEVGGSICFPESGYGSPILGWPDDIARVTRPRLMDYAQTYYRPDNAAIVLVGAVTPAAVRALAEKYFAPIARPQVPLNHRITEPLASLGARYMRMKTPAVNFGALAWRVPGGAHPDAAVFETLAALLGGQESGLMRRTIVDQGHALAAQAFLLPIGGESLFVVFGVPTRDRPSVFVERLRNLLAQIKLGGVRSEELERVQKHLLLEQTGLLEDSDAIAQALCDGFAEGGDPTVFLARKTQAAHASIDDLARIVTQWLGAKDALVLYGKPRSIFESEPNEAPFMLEGVPLEMDAEELAQRLSASLKANAPRFSAEHLAARKRYDQLVRLAPSRGGRG